MINCLNILPYFFYPQVKNKSEDPSGHMRLFLELALSRTKIMSSFYLRLDVLCPYEARAPEFADVYTSSATPVFWREGKVP
jgi:hypothetical protein